MAGISGKRPTYKALIRMTDQPKIPKPPKAAEDFADTRLRYRPKPSP